MSSIENYDGLCGWIHPHCNSDKRVRCNYEFGHSGSHSWENKPLGFTIMAGCFANDMSEPGAHKRFIPTNEGRKRVVIGKPDISE